MEFFTFIHYILSLQALGLQQHRNFMQKIAVDGSHKNKSIDLEPAPDNSSDHKTLLFLFIHSTQFHHRDQDHFQLMLILPLRTSASHQLPMKIPEWSVCGIFHKVKNTIALIHDLFSRHDIQRSIEQGLLFVPLTILTQCTVKNFQPAKTCISWPEKMSATA